MLALLELNLEPHKYLPTDEAVCYTSAYFTVLSKHWGNSSHVSVLVVIEQTDNSVAPVVSNLNDLIAEELLSST